MKSLTLRTRLYIYATYVAGIAIVALQIKKLDLSSPWLLSVLCVLASLALILKVEGATNRSHYTFSFLVYGFTFAVYGSTEAILVIMVSNLVEWIWNKPAWYIQLFNTGSYILVMAVSWTGSRLDQSRKLSKYLANRAGDYCRHGNFQFIKSFNGRDRGLACARTKFQRIRHL